MNRRWRLCAAMLLSALLTGCAQLNALTSPPSPRRQVERWVSQEQYGKALQALQQGAGDTAAGNDLEARRARIVALAEAYQERQLEAARKEEKAGNWNRAEQTLATALDHYPQGKGLRAAFQTLHERRVKRVNQLHRELLLARGEWLARAVPARQELTRITSFDLFDRLQLRELRSESASTSAKLAGVGREALDAGQLDLAKRCLSLARQLQDSPAVDQALQEIDHRQQEVAHAEELKRQRHEQADKQRREAALQQEVQGHIAAGEWQDARASLAKLMALDRDNPELTRLKQALDQAIAARIQQLLDRGNSLYRDGKIRAAKETWEAVLELDPRQSQARANAERAQRVLNKLRELKRQEADPANAVAPAANPPPQTVPVPAPVPAPTPAP